MKLAFLGLGNMGLNLALNLKEHGHDVIGWNRSAEKRDTAKDAGLEVRESLPEAINELNGMGRKIVFLLVSAGPAVDSLLFDPGNVYDMLDEGDIVIEGANSHFKDSQDRGAKFAEKGIQYLDCGISGGVNGARNGACMMVGGHEESFHYVEELFRDACVERGYGYFGESGAGHYVKMVHNAIEYGMMQAIAEGLNLLELSQFPVDMRVATSVWSNGSIIESNLIKFLSQALDEDPKLDKVSPEIGSLGTARWAVVEALEKQAPFANIANSVFTRFESRQKDVFEQKVIQAMRTVFGAHTSSERPVE